MAFKTIQRVSYFRNPDTVPINVFLKRKCEIQDAGLYDIFTFDDYRSPDH